MNPARRLTLVHAALAIFGVVLVGRAAQVQLVQHERWTRRAKLQHFAAADLPAPRGAIMDATGVVLAESRELVQLSVAPREVRDAAVLRRALRSAGMPADVIRRAADRGRAWVVLPGRHLPSDVAPLVALRGVHARPVVERVYASAAGTRALLGRARPAAGGVDGVELALDALLTGERGRAQALRDARGRQFESPAADATAPRPGHAVTLTIRHTLQDITERALANAITATGASGGDIVVLDPRDGEILAMNSRRHGSRSTTGALTEPFEPGSTLKPFVVAELLERRRARPDETIGTFNGTWTFDGRTIRDSHAAAAMSLTDVVRFSSNIGIVRFAERLRPGEQYELLRDLGFGMATGVPFPSEAAGTLYPPRRWSRTSAASLAMGYELAVTPLQLALAYAAIANGGELLAPALVKEVRTPEGEVRWRHERRVVRRVMAPETAATVRRMLTSVVDSGTAKVATLSMYELGGKTGTARRTAGGRGYAAGSYTASFVGLFPAEHPQLVILVKLDDPRGAYYGGETAAPVSKVVLESALAARDAVLDRSALAQEAAPRGVRERAAGPALRPVTAAAAEPAPPLPDAEGVAPATPPEPVLVELPVPPPRDAPDVRVRRVPDVRDLPVRVAVRTLHAAGFRVALAPGASSHTLPAAGTELPGGSLVRLVHPR